MVKSVDTTASSVYLQPMQHRMLALHTICNFSRGTRQQTPGFLEAEAQAQAKGGCSLSNTSSDTQNHFPRHREKHDGWSAFTLSKPLHNSRQRKG